MPISHFLPGFQRLALLLPVLLPPAAQAAGGGEALYFSDLPVVTSVSRLPQPLADAPTSVTVIDRDTIKASGARDLSDIFRLVPGFQTYANTTEAARVTYHGLGDGDYGSRVQVLIDGRSMFSPLFGDGVNWATLPVALEDIERIEVVRGTNAVSYGTNAFLGVINIITVDPSLVRGVSVSVSHGNQNVRDYMARTGGKIGEVGHFRFTYRSQNDDALRNRYDWIDSYGTQLLDLRADFTLSDRDGLQVSLARAEGQLQSGRLIRDRRGYWVSTPENPIRNMRQSSSYAQLNWRRALSSAADLQLRIAHSEDGSSDAFGVGPFTLNLSGDEGTRDEIELQHTLYLVPSARLAWGGTWRNDGMRSAWTLPGMGTVHRETSRLFGNVEWKPVAWFTSNLGLALENDAFAGDNAMPRLSTSFHLDAQNTLRFGVSRANRAASTDAYRGRQARPDNGDVIYAATPGIPVERLDTLEIGYLGDWKAWRASLDARLFNERVYDRLFRLNLDMAVPYDRTIENSTLPIQNVRIAGVEYQFKWQPFEPTRIVLSQAFARIKSGYLASAQALTDSAAVINAEGIREFTDNSTPSRTTSLLLMQKLPFGLAFSTAAYWQEAMKWSTNTSASKYHRIDARLGYPFRFGAVGGEVALTVQSLNGSHSEYKSDGKNPDGRIVDRRQWLSLRLDY